MMQAKDDRSADQKAWEHLQSGNMSGISFAGKTAAVAMFKRMKPNNLADTAIALALGQCLDDCLDEGVEVVLSARESAEKQVRSMN